MLTAYVCNVVLALAFVLALLFTMHRDINTIVQTPSGFPFLEIVMQSTNSIIATCFLIAPLVVIFIQTTADINISASRSLYAFARSNALPAATFLAKVNDRLDVPVNAVIAVACLQIPLLWIYVGNSNAFTAFITMPTEALTLTYGLSSFLMLVRGRKSGVDKASRFRLGPIVGPICNVVATVWSVCLTFFLMLPPTYPVDASNMK